MATWPKLLGKEEPRAAARPPPSRLSLLVDEVPAPVLLPTLFVGLGAERLLFAVADGLDAVGADAGLHQGLLDGVGAVIAQCQVVLGRAAFVAVPLDGELDVGVLREELSVPLQRGLLVGTNVVLVIVKENVFDVLSKELLFRGRRLRRRRRRRDRHTSGRVRGPAGSLCRQVIGRGLVGRNLLGAAGLDGAHAVVDADVGRVLCLPTQRGGLALLNGIRIGRQGRGWGGRRGWWWRRGRCDFLFAPAQQNDCAQGKDQSDPLQTVVLHLILPSKLKRSRSKPARATSLLISEDDDLHSFIPAPVRLGVLT